MNQTLTSLNRTERKGFLARISGNKIFLPIPESYSFESLCKNSLWVQIPPFGYHPRSKTLVALHDLGTTVCQTRTSIQGKRLQVMWESSKKLDPEEKNLLLIQMRRILALDWNLKPFFDTVRQELGLAWIAEKRQGWFLRSTSFFEDVVKALLFSNVTVEQGKVMLQRLIAEFGKPAPAGMKGKTFPSPIALLNAGVSVLREKIKAGYKSQTIVEVAHRFLKGDLQEGNLIHTPLVELKRKLLSLQGISPYFVQYLMILLGRFEAIFLKGYCVTNDGRLLKSLSFSSSSMDVIQKQWKEWGGLLGYLLKEEKNAV
jgi:3-methyladenine DNA glycosylase/8-oxoguanine DNA glycosylase